MGKEIKKQDDPKKRKVIDAIKHRIEVKWEESREEQERIAIYQARYEEQRRKDMRKKIDNNPITKFFKQKKEELECSNMQYLLHMYFDLNGLGMSKEEIAKVNEYIQHTMVLNDTQEMKQFAKHITMLDSIKGGMQSFKNDREKVIAKLKAGEIVSKTDACIATDRVIMNDRRVTVLKGTGSKLVEVELHPSNLHVIVVEPDAEQTIKNVPYTAEMDRDVRRFQNIRTVVFPDKKAKATPEFDFDDIKELDEQLAHEQELFHKYFDLGGEGLTQEEIDLVNSYIKQIIVLTHPAEIKNFEKHLHLMSSLNGGMEAFAEDRKNVKARLEAGEVITKTDACIATDSVIIKSGEKFYIITVSPKAKQPISRVDNPRYMITFVEQFDKVKSQAFTTKTM